MAVIVLDLEPAAASEVKGGKATSAAAGLVLIMTLFWFSFPAPSVIARWTEGNYTLIAAAISLLAGGWVLMSLLLPQWCEKIGSRALVLGNVLFTASLTMTILSQRVPFPMAPDSAPVTVTSPGLLSQTLLIIVLVSFPILFVDLRLFLKRIHAAAPAPGELARGFLLGVFIMVAVIFINIFSNVWGYVPPVSPLFRGTFWLAYFILAGVVTLLAWMVRGEAKISNSTDKHQPYWEWGTFLLLLFVGTVVMTLPIGRVQAEAEGRSTLTVMSFNTQQSNDELGERSFEQQLELMRRVDPDVIALQESDSARISLNNNDYVRYFAERLGYYSYYGPTPVTGTYGTAILSRYPLMDTRTVFTYSDTDEIGTAEAEIVVGGRRFTIYNVHPAGSDAAMLAFAGSLLERMQDDSSVIALGDYNLRDHEAAYQLIDRELKNAWTIAYPSEISPAGVDMSGENRIDHIFVSPELNIRNPVYLLPPDSATDHPVHWVELIWEVP
jgi:endonuclease/exonuclease/phosphatase family metal-dependent hydrolase